MTENKRGVRLWHPSFSLMQDLGLNRAAEINRLHSQMVGQAKTTIQIAIRIGELLTEEKKECVHGAWLPWLEENTKISPVTANRYMNCYRHRDRVKSIANDTFEPMTIEELARKNGKSRKPVQPREHQTLIEGLYKQGVSTPEIVKQTGVGKSKVYEAVREIRARESAEPEVTPEMLSMSAREKFDAAIRQQVKKLMEEFQVKVNAEINRRWEIASEELRVEREQHKRVMNARTGFMTRAVYKKILTCLHPDWVTDEKQKRRYEDAFIEFQKLEKCVLSEKESPTSWAAPLPKTAAEWEEHRRKTAEARKAKRDQKDKGQPLGKSA